MRRRSAPASGRATPSTRRPKRAAVLIAAVLSALLATLAWTGPAGAELAAADPPAAADPALLCEAAAAQAARESGVPLSVLRAISLTETGRRRGGGFKPWPWTVNMEGAGVWFDSEDEARADVFRHHQRGARSYDVGCFQINYRWHGQHFASIEEMFDPLVNARYAARFLSELHGETGDWSRAAGAYHSRTREYADRYRARFDRFRARLDGAPPPEELPRLAAAEVPGAAPGPEPAPVRVNNFALLQAAVTPTGLGSLVPLAPAAGGRLIDPAGGRPVAEDADAG